MILVIQAILSASYFGHRARRDFIEGTEGGRKIAVGHRELCNGYDELNFLHYLLFFTVPGKFFADPLLPL